MTVKRNMVSELCFAAEGLSGQAAASSLRKLGGIMDQAPSGRLFEAISTLADISAKAAVALEQGSLALDDMDSGEAATRLTAALAHMEKLAEPAAKKPRRRAAAR